MPLLKREDELVNRWMERLPERDQHMAAIHGIQTSQIARRLDIIITLLVIGLGIGLNTVWRAGLFW